MNNSSVPDLVFSLKSWPTCSSTQKMHRLSPVSRKIILDSGILMKEIFPCSVQEFAFNYELEMEPREYILQKYRQYEKRRLKKLKVLKALRLNHGKEKSKLKQTINFKNSNFLKSTKSTKGTNPNSREKEKEKKSQLKPKIKNPFTTFEKKSRQKSKAGSSHQDYFSGYKKYSPKCTPKKLSGKKRQKSKTQEQEEGRYSPVHEYYDSSIKTPYSPTKSPQSAQSSILNELDEVMQKWAEIDTLQLREFKAVGNLKPIEVKRLKTIHMIEKEQLKIEIESVKNKIALVTNSSRMLKTL